MCNALKIRFGMGERFGFLPLCLFYKDLPFFFFFKRLGSQGANFRQEYNGS